MLGMPEVATPALDVVRTLACDSLFVASRLYTQRPDGSLRYDGERPGPTWHIHGYLDVRVWVLTDGVVRRVLLSKRRWYEPDAKVTCHSRPPDAPVGARSSTLVVFVALWSWLSGEAGLHRYASVFPGIDRCASRRTVQRWLDRVRPHAMAIQHAILRAVIERSEPRPVERLFPQGLPPPRSLLRRHWKDPTMVGRLFRALVIAVAGCIEFQIPVSILLAEARGRWDGPSDSLVI